MENVSEWETDVPGRLVGAVGRVCPVAERLHAAARVIAELRDLTRYSTKMIEYRTKETRRVQSVPEAAGDQPRFGRDRGVGQGQLHALVAGEPDQGWPSAWAGFQVPPPILMWGAVSRQLPVGRKMG